ncbi:hypothetical protein ACSVDA_11645 [Cytobacillus sp. Hm23]
MTVLILLLFVLSLLFFVGMINYFSLIQRAVAYPPKQILRQKAAVLGGGGCVCLLLALSIIYFR